MNNLKHIENLLLDESFKDWALDRDEVNKAAWSQWIKVHPEVWDIIEDACYLIQNLEVQQIEIKQEKIDIEFEEVAEYYDQKFNKKEIKNRGRSLISETIKIAAVALIFILAGVGLYQYHTNNNPTAKYTTRGNEIEEIHLPDGSVVILNENSTLAFNKNWQEEKLRKVTLKGEAYFNVSKKAVKGQKIKFIVHSGDVKVEVLGTKFNINNNEQHTMVVLNSGKIRLTAPKESLNMKPGDVVEYQTETKNLIKKTVNPKKYTSWAESLNKTPVKTTETKKDRNENLSNNESSSKNLSSTKRERKYNNAERELHTKTVNPDQTNNKGKTSAKADNEIQEKQSSAKSVAGNGRNVNPNKSHYILSDIDENSSKTSNQSEIFQDGNNNNAYIEQIGEGLTSTQIQEGKSNEASTKFEGKNIKDKTDQLEWSTYQYQKGEGNRSVFELMESYNSNVYSIQEGIENASEATVKGEENILIMLQEGRFNEIRATQNGQNNQTGLSPTDPGIKQQGDYNEANINQNGNYNTIKIEQQGNNNKTHINQNDNKNF